MLIVRSRAVVITVVGHVELHRVLAMDPRIRLRWCGLVVHRLVDVVVTHTMRDGWGRTWGSRRFLYRWCSVVAAHVKVHVDGHVVTFNCLCGEREE